MESKERETAPKHRRGDAKRSSQNVTQEVETIQNLVELTDTGLEEATTEDWSTFVNALKIVKVDKTQDPLPGKKDHAQMYVPVLVRTALGLEGKTSVTMSLPDSGNLMAHAAIDAKFHQQLGVSMEATDIKARAANKQSLEILGVSKGIYVKFPNVNKTFFVKPLIVKNLSCKLNLGAQFNHQTGFIPQKVIEDSTGKRTNFSELDGIHICLQFQDMSNRTLQSTVGDS